MSKKKVLIVTESISYGGLNIASMKFEEFIDKSKYECVYCVRRNRLGELEQAVLDRGIRVVHVPDSELRYSRSYKFYKKLMSEGFDIVHCHLPFFSGIVLMAAYKCGVSKRIAHAHFTQPYTDTEIYSKKKQFIAKYYRKIMRLFLKKYCNVKIGCSREAGEFLFGKKEFEKHGIVLNNGIDIQKFTFNSEIRNEVRKELGIGDNEVVLGHIGQLYSVKNQSYIIDIFSEYLKVNPDSRLLLIGIGEDEKKLEKKIKELNLVGKALMLGARNDANRLYQAMDCFVFPSVHEGFPLTLIEAQASGLACLVSDRVNKITKFNDNFDFISIEAEPKLWADKIDSLISDRGSVELSEKLKDYDINTTAKELDDIYSN